jgi:hypothetical protein
LLIQKKQVDVVNKQRVGKKIELLKTAQSIFKMFYAVEKAFRASIQIGYLIFRKI